MGKRQTDEETYMKKKTDRHTHTKKDTHINKTDIFALKYGHRNKTEKMT